MEQPPLTTRRIQWIGRVANWDRGVVGAGAFCMLGILQVSILLPSITKSVAHISERRSNWGAGSVLSGVVSLPTAITALCLALVVVEVCDLIQSQKFPEARQLCRMAGSIAVGLHLALMAVGSASMGPGTFLVGMVVDLGFQALLAMLVVSFWLPRNESELYARDFK